jgi:hypothetical protein
VEPAVARSVDVELRKRDRTPLAKKPFGWANLTKLLQSAVLLFQIVLLSQTVG